MERSSLAWVKRARRASPTCSLRGWAIKPGRRRERRNEHANERHARALFGVQGDGAGSHSCRAAVLLGAAPRTMGERSEEHTSELQSLTNLVCRLLLEKKKNITTTTILRTV